MMGWQSRAKAEKAEARPAVENRMRTAHRYFLQNPEPEEFGHGEKSRQQTGLLHVRARAEPRVLLCVFLSCSFEGKAMLGVKTGRAGPSYRRMLPRIHVGFGCLLCVIQPTVRSRRHCGPNRRVLPGCPATSGRRRVSRLLRFRINMSKAHGQTRNVVAC